MKKAAKPGRDPEILAEYDFRGGVRGKYAARFAAGTNVVVLAPDVAEVFRDAESVNAGLRSIVKALPGTFTSSTETRPPLVPTS